MGAERFNLDGWYVVNASGIGLIGLACIDEVFISHKSDNPSALPFRPRILNPEAFHIARAPTVYVWDDSGTSTQVAAIAPMDIDNYDGAYDFLMRADIRDAIALGKVVLASIIGTSTAVSDAPVAFTLVVDDVVQSTEDVITISFRDTLVLFQRPLNVRYGDPWEAASSANQMVQIIIGACRNVPGQLIDEATNLYRLSDSVIGNVAAARDNGADLDFNADPPQVAPALNRSGVTLASTPYGQVLFDVSSVGTQAIQPGVPDVLGGLGILDDWTDPTHPPAGWSTGGDIHGTLTRSTALQGYVDFAASMTTNVPFAPPLGGNGFWMSLDTAVLDPGTHYRVSFVLDRTIAPLAPQGHSGLLVTTSLERSPIDAISGSPFGNFLDNPSWGDQYYSFTFEAPADGVERTIYMVASGDASLPNVIVSWHGLKVEKLGQFQTAQLDGIGLAGIWYEVLYNRDFQETTAWDSSSLTAIDDATGYDLGLFTNSPPNVDEFLSAALPSVCGTMQSLADGRIAAYQLIDPTDPLGPDPVAAFDLTNTERPIKIEIDRAQYLTSVYGGARNWVQPDDADLVSDQDSVPIAVRQSYTRKSQFLVQCTVPLAGQYSFARNAAPLHTVIDKPDQVLTEAIRVNKIYSPQVYSDGTIFNGLRHFVTFTAHFDDMISLGNGLTCAAQDLRFGHIVLLTYPEHGFENTRVEVVATDFYPFAQKIILKCFY